MAQVRFNTDAMVSESDARRQRHLGESPSCVAVLDQNVGRLLFGDDTALSPEKEGLTLAALAGNAVLVIRRPDKVAREWTTIARAIRAARRAGARGLLSLSRGLPVNEQWQHGELMLVRDHINLLG